MNFGEIKKIHLPIKPGTKIQSLCWVGDELVDFAAGGIRYRLDGSTEPAHVFYAYRFDRAIASRDGEYAVLYEMLGTKGIILHRGKHLREINRSYYHAHVYEYPIAILELRDRRIALAHCPESYNRLEIEELESGQKLTLREGESPDFFHSRLAVSPNAEYLLSAGWVWHPLDVAQVYSISNALKTAATLDKPEKFDFPDKLWEIHSAAFLDDHTLMMVGDDGGESGKEMSFLVQFNLKTRHVVSEVKLEEAAGTIFPISSQYLISFYKHPKVIDIASGKIVHRWPELNSGQQNSSIIWHNEQLPPLALDPLNGRFALADTSGITVIHLGSSPALEKHGP
jgi:hypothetical protein